MTNVQCTSGVSCLEECTHSTLTSGCTHSQDISVRCADPAPLQPIATPVPTATPGFIVGETLTYLCHDGYVLQGNAVRTCQSDGTWSGQEPVCNLCISSECGNQADCGILSNPANGIVTVSGLTRGSTATYTCNTGFMLVGDETRTCQNGMWSGEEPSCISSLCVTFYIVPVAYVLNYYS